MKILSCEKPTEQSTAGQQRDGYPWLGESRLTTGLQGLQGPRNTCIHFDFHNDLRLFVTLVPKDQGFPPIPGIVLGMVGGEVNRNNIKTSDRTVRIKSRSLTAKSRYFDNMPHQIQRVWADGHLPPGSQRFLSSV